MFTSIDIHQPHLVKQHRQLRNATFEEKKFGLPHSVLFLIHSQFYLLLLYQTQSNR
ncbi:unknown [Bacillus thuringiensis phage MZTP02]|uniref:Uncharacterized protein n=1 Tax=Bacillus thuringiensis phage MZTP02 TaxID=311221 RepID=Q56AS7_9CAUD|nr:unknown [Bacillus thuringiensis phage MZTP02]